MVIVLIIFSQYNEEQLIQEVSKGTQQLLIFKHFLNFVLDLNFYQKDFIIHFKQIINHIKNSLYNMLCGFENSRFQIQF